MVISLQIDKGEVIFLKFCKKGLCHHTQPFFFFFFYMHLIIIRHPFKTLGELLCYQAPSWHETKSSIEYLARRKRKRRNSEEWSDRDVFATSVQNSGK